MGPAVHLDSARARDTLQPGALAVVLVARTEVRRTIARSARGVSWASGSAHLLGPHGGRRGLVERSEQRREGEWRARVTGRHVGGFGPMGEGRDLIVGS